MDNKIERPYGTKELQSYRVSVLAPVKKAYNIKDTLTYINTNSYYIYSSSRVLFFIIEMREKVTLFRRNFIKWPWKLFRTMKKYLQNRKHPEECYETRELKFIENSISTEHVTFGISYAL